MTVSYTGPARGHIVAEATCTPRSQALLGHRRCPRLDRRAGRYRPGRRQGVAGVNGWNYATTWETIAREVPDREAIVCGDRRITFSELDHRADRLAHVLAAYGIGIG